MKAKGGIVYIMGGAVCIFKANSPPRPLGLMKVKHPLIVTSSITSPPTLSITSLSNSLTLVAVPLIPSKISLLGTVPTLPMI